MIVTPSSPPTTDLVTASTPPLWELQAAAAAVDLQKLDMVGNDSDDDDVAILNDSDEDEQEEQDVVAAEKQEQATVPTVWESSSSSLTSDEEEEEGQEEENDAKDKKNEVDVDSLPPQCSASSSKPEVDVDEIDVDEVDVDVDEVDIDDLMVASTTTTSATANSGKFRGHRSSISILTAPPPPPPPATDVDDDDETAPDDVVETPAPTTTPTEEEEPTPASSTTKNKRPRPSIKLSSLKDHTPVIKDKRSSWKQLPKPDMEKLLIQRASSLPVELETNRVSPRTTCSVSFSNIEIRNYSQTIGDNPSVSYGPPITLDWDYEQIQPISIDDYELHRGPRRHLRQMSLSYYQRQNLLQYCFGHSEEDVKAAKKQANRDKFKRAVTKYFLPVQVLEDAAESSIRKTKRFIGGGSGSSSGGGGGGASSKRRPSTAAA